MNRILFYVVLIFQALIIILFLFQFERIDQVGTEIKLVTVEKRGMNDYYFPLMNDAYLDYEITKIPPEKWNGSVDLDYKDTTYVLLQENKEGVYEIVEASGEKIK